MEHEGRFFGNMAQLNLDVKRFDSRIDISQIITSNRKSQTVTFDSGKISWILMRDYKDQMTISGMAFTQITFDLSFPVDCVSYCLSKVRGRQP